MSGIGIALDAFTFGGMFIVLVVGTTAIILSILSERKDRRQ